MVLFIDDGYQQSCNVVAMLSPADQHGAGMGHALVRFAADHLTEAFKRSRDDAVSG